MPEKDYLGKDQRRTKDVEKKEDKPIKGKTIILKTIYIIFQDFNFKMKLIRIALDEAEIALLKTYVSLISFELIVIP